MRLERRALAGLCLFAGALRIIAWARAGVMFNDGPVFIELAQAMSRGDWTQVLSHPYHPLYSLTVWSATFLGLDWETAGASVSIVAGAVCTAFLFWFLKDAFGRNAAWVGAILWAVHPRAVAFTSDVQSDGLYAMLFFGASALAFRGWQRDAPRWLAAAGVVSGLAYWTRPEGLGIALVVSACLAFDALRDPSRRATVVPKLAAVTLAAAVVVLPYVFAISSVRGDVTFTQKKSVTELAGLEGLLPGNAEAPAAEGTARDVLAELVRSADEFAGSALSAVRVEWLLPMLLGIWAAFGRPGPRARYLLATTALYTLVLLALAYHAGYVSKRHVLPVAALSLGYAGVGIGHLAELLAARWHRFSERRIAVALVAALAVVSLLPQLDARRSDRLAARAAAEWLRETRQRAPVAAAKQRLAYYADAPFVPLGTRAPDALVADLRARGARYFITDDDRFRELDTAADVTTLFVAESNGREARVFDLLASTEVEPARP